MCARTHSVLGEGDCVFLALEFPTFFFTCITLAIPGLSLGLQSFYFRSWRFQGK